MDRSRILRIIIIGTGILILLGLVFFVFFNKGTRIINRPTPSNTENPFGGGQLNPDGTIADPDTTSVIPETPVVQTITTLGKFRQLSAGPIAGYHSRMFTKTVVVSSPSSEASNPNQQFSTEVTVPIVRYVSAENGYVYDAEIDETTVTRTQITKTFIANVAEAIFDGKNKVAMRYANPQTEEIQTYDGVIPEKTPAPTICPIPLTKELKRGSIDPEVKSLQSLLNYLDGTNLKIDGSFGSGTEASVVRFQANNNLVETKIVDDPTRATMNQLCITIQAELDKKATEPVSLGGSFLGPNILQMIPIKTGGVFMLTKTATGSKGTTRIQTNGKDAIKEVYASPLTEWLPYDIGKNILVLATKPSGVVLGYAYYFDTALQTYTKITGDIKGLTVLPNSDGTTVLIGGILEGKGLRLGVFNKSTQMTNTSLVATLPEKCAFKTLVIAFCGVPVTLPNGTYPDDWYKNVVGFTDTLTRFDTTTGAKADLEAPTDLYSFDYTYLSFDPSNRYLLFVDKKTGVLWSYDTEL